ncbi:MAG: aspartyl/glutamyl-tRNA amidotransferase subunit C [Defluviitaleaceae bacterium]|nr:aspartyl/glutamyl-tRNA amidotransferase subunit C [Defluviitaleaceae bacterium]
MIDKTTVKKYAIIAGLSMGSDEDVDAINNFLKIIEGIKGFEEDGGEMQVEPAFGLFNVLREDEPGLSMPRLQVLENSPSVEAGCVSVPKMMKDEK